MGDDSSDDEVEDEEKVKYAMGKGYDEDYMSMPFVDWPRFNMVIGVLIMGNAACLGAELDIGNPDLPIEERMEWYVMEFIFTTIFFFELIARLYYKRMHFFTSFMNLLDFVLVALQVLEAWILVFFPQSENNMRVFSIFRVLRMAKLIRLLRVIPSLHEVYLIMNGLMEATKTLGWVCVLLVLDLYIFAVLFTTQVGHNDSAFDPYFRDSKGWDHELYFGTVSKSMFSLFQILTLDSWAEDIARHVCAMMPGFQWVFILFITLTTFGLLSIVVGVIGENILQEASSNKKEVAKKQDAERSRIMDSIREVFALVDKDNSGNVSLLEVKRALQNPEVNSRLRMIDFPVGELEEIFMLLDTDRSGSISIQSFIKGCMRLKGDAKSKDLLEVQINVEALGKDLALLDEKFGLANVKIRILAKKTKKMAKQSAQMFADPASRRKWRVN